MSQPKSIDDVISYLEHPQHKQADAQFRQAVSTTWRLFTLLYALLLFVLGNYGYWLAFLAFDVSVPEAAVILACSAVLHIHAWFVCRKN